MTNENVLNNETQSAAKGFYYFSFEGLMAGIFTVLTVLFLIYYFFDIANKESLNLICDISQSSNSIAAFLLALRISRNKLLDDRTKSAWQKLAFAFFSFACGQFVWFYLNSIVGEPPFPSTADIGYIGFYPLMLWALRSFPTAPQTTSDKKKFWLDASTVMVSSFVVVYHFIIQPVIYVIGDMVLFLGIITILFKKPKEYSRTALYTIILGLISVAISDIGFAYYTLQNISPTGTWAYAFFSVSSYFMVLAAFIQYKSAKKHVSDETLHVFQSAKFGWLPYISVAIGYTMLLIVSKPYWSEPIGVFIFATFIISGLVVMRQITAVRENLTLVAEQSEKKSELKLHSLLTNSSDITTIIDEKGNFEYLSPAIHKVFGYNPDQLKGTSIYDLVHPEDHRKLRKTYQANVNNYNNAISIEYRFKHADETWHDLDAIGQIILDEETKTTRVLLNGRDVTAKKADEIQLRQYTKKLQVSNRELQDFAFVASHDLQEPLRKVQAFGERLSDKFGDQLGETGIDYLRRMQSASSRMQVLITDLLTYSRVTTQAKPFVESELNTVLTDVLSDLEIKIDSTNAELAVADLPKIDMDEVQMRQLFQNLIGNALKFSRPETIPQIRIWCDSNQSAESNYSDVEFNDFAIADSETPRGFCRIFVEDNGIGFDEKYLDRVFTVFQRLHGRAEYEGSGVGLAVCRKIVERHNGNLTATSKPGNGTTFIITLPFKQAQIGENYELKTIDNIISR
jgi:PAS domain S-box-containing protein